MMLISLTFKSNMWSQKKWNQ